MISKVVTILVALATIVFFVGCSALHVPGVPGMPGAKSVAKKAVTEGNVEVLDVNVEKVTGPTSYGVKITGNAVYHPAKVSAKSFKKAGNQYFHFDLYDAKGLKLPVSVSFSKHACGEFRQPENIVADKPFPFEHKENIAWSDEPDKIAIWEKVSTAKFVKWE